MQGISTTYGLPNRRSNHAGEERRVGLELEFGELSLPHTLMLIARELGGMLVQTSPTQGRVEGTPFGTFRAELDSTALKERAYLRPLEALGIDKDSSFAHSVEESVLGIASELVPVEVVTPPIPITRLGELDGLWLALRQNHAADTRASIWNAFGLHFNPEPPDLTLETILSTFRAFLLLEDNIRRQASIDFTRRITPYIQPFPEGYRRLVLAPDYAPDFPGFVDDYVSHNPTRNRPLDLLPLIRHVVAPDLTGRVNDLHLVNARPTFHYRLPNCEIGRANWSPALDWNRWLAVERLAESKTLLSELSADYLRLPDLPLRLQSDRWADHVARRLGFSAESMSEATWP